VKSLIHQKPEKRATVRCLGLNKISSKAVHNATPAILGMVASVAHLVVVKEID
jgi:large subunit ribosomal protein L30